MERFKRLILAILALSGFITTGSASELVKKSDTFSDGVRNTNLWISTSANDVILVEQSDRLFLYRDRHNPHPDQSSIWKCTFSGKETAWIYDVSVNVRLSHLIVAPTGDSNDKCSAGLGLYFKDASHYIELKVVDALAGRKFYVYSYNGAKLSTASYPIPSDAESQIVLRLTLDKGNIKTLWRKPGDATYRKIAAPINAASIVPGADPSTILLRPYLTGSLLGGVRCPVDWRVWMDSFTLLYQQTQ